MLAVSYFVSMARAGPMSLILATGIALAFGFAFSLDNLRIPSRYSRAIGVVFGVLHGWLLVGIIQHAWLKYDWSRTAAT